MIVKAIPYVFEEKTEELKEGDLVIDSKNSVYIITQVNEHTYNTLNYSKTERVDCIPKKSLKPFYGSMTLTSSKIN